MASGSQIHARSFGVADYDAYWAARKAAGTHRMTRLQRFLADEVARIVPPGGAVLDCGVGPGNVYRLLAQSGRRMYGIEISAEAVSLYDFDASNIVMRDLNRGLGEFPVKFDAIIMAHVLHHLDDPAAFVKDALRSLAPGGCFVVAIPNITYYAFRLAFMFGKFPPISLAHKNFQTPAEFEEMVRSVGLTIVRRASAKKTLRARLFPAVFSQDIVYVLKPAGQAADGAFPG